VFHGWAIAFDWVMIHCIMLSVFLISKRSSKLMNYYFTNVVIFVVYWALMAHIIFLKGLSENTEIKNVELISQLNDANET
jgi:hypothetical protein